MIILILHILVFIGLLFALLFYFKKKEPILSLGFLPSLRTTPQNLKSKPHLFIFVTYILFLLFPLTIGLSYYLHSDANVLVVIIWILWTYNWVKYTFWRE